VRYLEIPGIDRPISRLVIGSTWFGRVPYEDVARVLDRWIELGGNAIDTAENYGRGASELAIGRWLRERALGADAPLVITKGGHPYDDRSRLGADDLAADLDGSRQRLGLETLGLWMLHRDDASLAVREILETVSPFVADGRVRALGASNWTTDRLAEAAGVSGDDGLAGFVASSPNLSLARQLRPPWPDCVSASDGASRRWYADAQLPLFAWSASAGGYFAGGARQPDPSRDDAMAGVYDSDDNRERYRRAADLASRIGATADQVALAWVLAQPFPTFAVIGTRNVDHLAAAVEAVDIELSPHDVEWLDSGFSG
jgi:aryl-alcohol dehydrogenase-like predicted oxidoreductase